MAEASKRPLVPPRTGKKDFLPEFEVFANDSVGKASRRTAVSLKEKRSLPGSESPVLPPRKNRSEGGLCSGKQSNHRNPVSRLAQNYF